MANKEKERPGNIRKKKQNDAKADLRKKLNWTFRNEKIGKFEIKLYLRG